MDIAFAPMVMLADVNSSRVSLAVIGPAWREYRANGGAVDAPQGIGERLFVELSFADLKPARHTTSHGRGQVHAPHGFGNGGLRIDDPQSPI